MALEAKASAQGHISGLASPFGGEPDTYGDVIAPGAYAASLARHEAEKTAPVMLWGHDQTRVVGRWDALHERADGLHVEGFLNMATAMGRDAFEHLKAGDLSGLSIGFVVPKDGASMDYRTGVRTLTKIDLWEISLVALPAARRARVRSVKSIGGPEELRDLLRSHGLPHRFCEKVAAGGWAALEGKSIEDLEAEARAAAVSETLAQALGILRETAKSMR
nr:HK97 family phage prohead protease [Defluviimonas sediminis]